MKKYIITIDQGTTSTRALLIDKDINILKTSKQRVSQIYPKSGYIEQDAEEIYDSVVKVIDDILLGINPKSIITFSIANQRETTVIWDKNTGKPVHNAIVWQSTQTDYICERYKEHEKLITSKTGLPLHPYFCASKIRYILENIENGQERALNGELLFGTIDSYLVYKLTNNHYTDYSNASRTLLFNINELCWDEELLKIFDIPKVMLPDVKNTADDFGMTKLNIPINCVIGDQQAATFGQQCYEENEVKATYGTGLFILANTGQKPVYNDYGLLTTILWKIDNKVKYALEGSVFFAASALEWLKDSVHVYDNDNQIDDILKKANEDSQLIVIPTFSGLTTPYWKSNVRGAMYNITRSTTDADIVKSTIESIAFSCKDVIDVMDKYLNTSSYTFKVDGGMSANDYFLQFQANALNHEVKRPLIIETTALGAALVAGLYTKVFENEEEIKCLFEKSTVFKPQKDVNDKYKKYKHAIQTTIKYHE